ncbi:acyl-CoA N-acyltransferase [Thozetella sp. PMI_491]|nr:acyl-CoA N-acyltransferase [Thozetella sp. PMI_491]
MEKNEEDKKFVGSFWIDPVSRGLAGGLMFYDRDMQSRQEDVEKIINYALLAVVICLPPAETKSQGHVVGAVEQRAAERANSTPIGWLRFSKIKENDYPRRITAMSLSIHESYQNQGYGTEALNWALDWGFNFAGFYKVELTTASYNHRALRLYNKAGFTEEGRRRHHCFMAGKPYDIVEFGILEPEYRKLRENN